MAQRVADHDAVAVSMIVFACVFGSSVAGILLHRALPANNLSSDSENIVTVSMGLVVTLAALVLGLLVSSAKGFYDNQNSELTHMSARVILIDRILAHYGPETKEIRDRLRGIVADSIHTIWPQEFTHSSKPVAPPIGTETLIDDIQALSPKDDRQRSLQSQALSAMFGLAETRWLMYEQGDAAVSGAMLVILVSWLAAIFISFGLFAPCNATVIAALFVAGLSVSGAIFLILEMYAPFRGVIKISSAHLRSTLTQLGQ
jgi:hypothetical protein